jgi:hypothetical protein
MFQPDRGDYRQKKSTVSLFLHSCLGQIVIFVAILCVLMLVAHLTRPDAKAMTEEMNDNVRQWIESKDSINTDWMDDAVTNISYAFTHAGPEQDKELMKNFNDHNKLTPHVYAFFSTMYIYNTFRSEGERCGIGIFGMVIPTVNFNHYLLHEEPMRSNYNEPLVEPSGDNEYFGESPGLEPFRYNGE